MKVVKQVPEVMRLWVFAVIFVVFVVRFEVVVGFVLVEDMVAVVTAVDIVLSEVTRYSRFNRVVSKYLKSKSEKFSAKI